MKVKNIIPKPIRRLYNFLFRAPQRKMAGWWTVFTDITTYLEHFFAKKNRTPLQAVTICTGLKNRSDNYLNILLDSLDKAENKDLISLSIFDCGSEDHAQIEDAIRAKWAGKVIYHSENREFARAIAFNKAVRTAQTELVFLCDADIQLPTDIVKRINDNVRRGRGWFPIVRWMNEDGSSRYATEACGLVACFKVDMEKAGMLNESITRWGHEDWLLYFAFYKSDMAALRTHEWSIVHHWHPSEKWDGFVKLF